MAKKKNKKNNQKQVEVAAPPESPKPAAAPATEEPPASEAAPEAQEQAIAPPPETASDELPVTDSASVPQGTPGDIQDKPGEDEAPIVGGSETIGDATTSPQSDHVAAASVASDEMVTDKAVDLPEQTPAEDDTQIASLEQPSVTGIAEQTQTQPISSENTTAHMELNSAQDSNVKADSETAPEGEVQLEPLEESAPTAHTEDSVPVEEVQPSPVLEALAEAQQSQDVERSHAEMDVAIEPSEEALTVESPAAAEPTVVESEQTDQQDHPSEFTTHHAPETGTLPPVAAEEPPTELSEDIAPASPVQETSRPEETNESPLSVPEQSALVETASALEAPAKDVIPSSLPSDVPSVAAEEAPQEDSLPAPAPEQILQKDLPSPSTQEAGISDDQPSLAVPVPPVEEQTQPVLEPESTDWVVPPPKKETSKQRRKREAEEKRQREEQEELEQKEFEQYRIDQERMEMARLEQKRLEREKARQERRAKEQAEQTRLEQERVEQERLEKARLEQERLEQERLEQERLEKARLEQERLEQEKLEKARQDQERLELEKLDRERLERETIEQKRLEDLRLEKERVEKERIEQEKIQQANLERERLDAERRVEERIEKERLERQRIEHEAMEQKKLQQAAEATARAAELARNETLKAEAEVARNQQKLEASATSTGNTAREVDPTYSAHASVHELSRSIPSPVPHKGSVPEVAAEPLQLSTPPPEAVPEPPTASSVPPNNPVNRLPTPAASVGRSNSPHSVATDAPKPRANASDPLSPPDASHSRVTSDSSALPAPKPQAVSQIIQDSRPPAPSPPVTRARPRHVPAFDSEDESDSALVRPRRQFRGGEDYTRDGSSGSQGYPPQTTHRFASRVPPEPSYANAPPPPQPPGYHPGYYPPTAPPHYQNHNYRMSQQGYSHPNSYGPPSHSSASPYTEQWNYQSGYRHDSPPQRHDTLVARDYPLGLAPIDTRSAIGDDPGDVFSRIAQTIPDLHVLLARYKETHSQLSVREELLRRSGLEQEEKLRAKDDEIADLKERSRNLEHRYSTEASRLRLQIGNLEEQARELQEQRRETERFKKEAQDTKAALDAAMKSWEARYRELEEAHAALVRTSAEEKAKTHNEFDEWKSTYTTRNDAEKIALAIQFDKRLKEADVLAENQKQEAAAAYVKEKEELRADHQRQQLERQASFDRVRNELETKLGSAQIDREEALKHERESREVWLAEREALIKSHQDDRESTRKGWDEQRDLLEAQFRKSKDESDKAWLELHADATRKADEQKAQVDQLIKEKEELHKKYNALRAESEQEKAIIKSVATNLESEKSRLEKLMECYGDIAEIKSKGDTYYSVSFSQLQKQIIDLATTHFVHLPVRPPAEDLAQVPSNLPSFLGDTVASRQVRAAYIAHTVSKLITYRVFGPFLFSLGRRYDKADSLFLSMSHHIRDKSTRKEAIWRQQTLLAAFTSSGAKQRINTAAGTVVEEIVSAIKHFADPREEEGIKIAVKRIVKLAAETWRFARLEREMINATMPALLDEEHQFTGPEYWPSYDSYKPEGTLIGSLVGTTPPSDEQPQLLLRLFPVIWRESKHENFHIDGEKADEGCIYHHGLALYDDAEPVVQRLEELKSAGLPTHTITVSPTIAESGKFPPPIVPPPREALPHPPATAEKSDRSTTKSTPHSPTEFLDTSSSRHTTPPPPPSSIPSLSEPTPKPVKAYKRPAPGPIEFASPRNFIGMPPPVESMAASIPPYSRKTSDAPSASRRSEPTIPEAAPQIPEASEAVIAPPHRPPPPPPAVGPIVEPSHLAPDESGVLPHFPEPSPSESKSRNPPTPPHSRSGTPTERPVSPLFEAIDEIEALETHRSRKPSTSISRRKSTHKRRSKELKEELPEVIPTTERPDTSRRTSGYALSTRSVKTVDTERTDRTDRTDKTEKTERSEKTDRTDKTERDPKSRYMCESRSAAVKALYPNSPMAGQSTSNSSSKNSVSSSKKKDRDSKELKREKSIADNSTWIPDNGTWDTSSNRTSEGTNTQFSTC